MAQAQKVRNFPDISRQDLLKELADLTKPHGGSINFTPSEQTLIRLIGEDLELLRIMEKNDITELLLKLSSNPMVHPFFLKNADKHAGRHVIGAFAPRGVDRYMWTIELLYENNMPQVIVNTGKDKFKIREMRNILLTSNKEGEEHRKYYGINPATTYHWWRGEEYVQYKARILSAIIKRLEQEYIF